MPLRDFINAWCYGNTPENWNALLTEYYTARKDKSLSVFIRHTAIMSDIEKRAAIFDIAAEAIKKQYHPDIAEGLKIIHPRFKWTEQSYLEDIKHATNFEKNNFLQYEESKKTLDSLQARNKGTKSADDMYESFRHSIMQINEKAGYAQVTDDSTAYDYAIAASRLELYITEMENSKKKK